MGSRLYGFAMSYFILKLTGSAFAFGVSLALTTIPMVLISPFAGVLSDRFNKKRTLIYSDLTSGAVMLLFLISVSIWPIKVAYIYLSVFLLAILETVIDINISASIPLLVDRDMLKRANSMDQSITSLCKILGSVLGGAVYLFVDIRFFILLNGISFILSALLECFLSFRKEEGPEEADLPISVLKSLEEGWSHIKSIRFLFLLSIFVIIFNFSYHMGFTVCFPYVATNILKLSSWQFGIASGALSMSALATALCFSIIPGKKAGNEAKYPTGAIYGLAATLFFLGIVASPMLNGLGKNLSFLFLISISLVIGVFIVMINVPTTVLIQELADPKYLGRVMGLINCFACMAVPIAMLTSGYLIDKIPAYFLTSSGSLLLVLAGLKLSSLQGAFKKKNVIMTMQNEQ